MFGDVWKNTRCPLSSYHCPWRSWSPCSYLWFQARLPAPERKPGRPRTFSDLSLLLFHLVRALLGFSTERLCRELARNPGLRRRLVLRRVLSASTLREPEATLAPPAGREAGGPEKAWASHGLHPPSCPIAGPAGDPCFPSHDYPFGWRGDGG